MTERFGTDLAGISKQIFRENAKIRKGFNQEPPTYIPGVRMRCFSRRQKLPNNIIRIISRYRGVQLQVLQVLQVVLIVIFNENLKFCLFELTTNPEPVQTQVYILSQAREDRTFCFSKWLDSCSSR